ncbi:MAG TPA: transposase [Bryobacteraceae bacterium]|nr:transposase [Bryobacteraceae bacterium]
MGHPIFLTWRLAGSLPANRAFPAVTTSGKAFLIMDRLLDSATTGPLHLRRPEFAGMVIQAIRHLEDEECFILHAFVVMANHVHLLITAKIELSKLTHSLKRFTAREGNRLLGVCGQPFWQDESYDRWVRGEREFERIASYIEMNPVNAGLCATPEDFPWSSAGRVENPPQVANLPHISTHAVTPS